MDDIKINGKLKGITAKPDKDGDVIVTIQIEADFSQSALRLMPRAGQSFRIRFDPQQLDLTGTEAALTTNYETFRREGER